MTMVEIVPQEKVPDLEAPHLGAPDVLQATPRGRLYLAGLFTLVFALTATFQFFAFPLLTASLKAGPATNAVFTMKIILVSYAAIVISVAVFVIWYGRRILSRMQFPLPGAWVWRDTTIKRGQSATRIARLHFLTGAVFIIMCIGLTVYLWNKLDSPMPQYNLPKGALIVR